MRALWDARGSGLRDLRLLRKTSLPALRGGGVPFLAGSRVPTGGSAPMAAGSDAVASYIYGARRMAVSTYTR